MKPAAHPADHGATATQGRALSSEALRPPRHLLPVIVVAQFACTSLWFAVNAVMPDLQRERGLPPESVGTLTSAVQLGFIVGTLVFALLTIADRFRPTRVFLCCALLGALFNALSAWGDPGLAGLAAMRAATGFCLAGIYPVGMKIAAGWYRTGLGTALGWLVGALVVGTALPHGLRALGTGAPWTWVVLAVSLLAVAGGLIVWRWVPDSPSLPPATSMQPRALMAIWRHPPLRASAFGYFGHMWELYTALVLLPALAARTFDDPAAISWLSFFAIAAGGAGCVVGGFLARRFGSARVAAGMLAISGSCCLAEPLALISGDQAVVAWLVLWGFSVAGDSPQFSALSAQNAPRQAVGSVLTLVNSIGFSISIISIQLYVALAQQFSLELLLPWLALGPLLGLVALSPLLRRSAPAG